VRLVDVDPSEEARELAVGQDPRHLEVILRETERIVRARPPLVIAETKHGFVCASAGVDASNAPAPDTLVLLPRDPDASAAELVMGKLDAIPAAVVRGLDVTGEGSARELVMPPERDLFGR